MLIPARNAEGLFIALHKKPAVASPANYMCVSVGSSFKLGTGDFPLFCCWFDWSACHTAALVEGGLKAYVCAHRAARVKVIGAAGGQFWQSQHELMSALARMAPEKVICSQMQGQAGMRA